MKKTPGLLFTLFVVLAAAYAFSPRHGVPLPATQMNLAQSLLLGGARTGQRVVAVGERGVIFASDDGGAQWHSVSSGTQATLTAACFADEHSPVGLAVGHDATIIRTEDSGRSWQTVWSAPDQLRPLLDVLFIDRQRAIAVGAYGAYLESTDAGRSFQERKITPGDRHLNALARLADGTLLIAGEAGTLLRSTDGGAHWQLLPAPYAGSFFGLQALADGAVLAYGMRGTLLRSADRGNHWTAVSVSGEGAQSSPARAHSALLASFADAQGRVIVVGPNDTILMSDNQGASFVRQDSGAGARLWTQALGLPTGSGVLLLGEGVAYRLPWTQQHQKSS
jgi:photosystem II stability/assembly factor-like uncharacterized protein